MEAAVTVGSSASQTAAATSPHFGPVVEQLIPPAQAIDQARATLAHPVPSFTAKKRLTPSQARRGAQPRTPTPHPRTPKPTDVDGTHYPILRSAKLDDNYVRALVASLDNYMTRLRAGNTLLRGDSLSPHRPMLDPWELEYSLENHGLDQKLFSVLGKSVVRVLNTLTTPLDIEWYATHDDDAGASVGQGDERFLYTAASDLAVAPVSLQFLGARGEIKPANWAYMVQIHAYLASLVSFPRTRVTTSDNNKKSTVQVQKPDGSWGGGTQEELMALQISAIVSTNKVRVEAAGYDSKHVSVVVMGEDSYFHVRGTASEGQLDLSVSPLYQNVTDRYLDQPGDVSLRALLVAASLATLAGDVLGLELGGPRPEVQALIETQEPEGEMRGAAGAAERSRSAGVGPGPPLGGGSGGFAAIGESGSGVQEGATTAAMGSDADGSSVASSEHSASSNADNDGEAQYATSSPDTSFEVSSKVGRPSTSGKGALRVCVRYGLIQSKFIELKPSEKSSLCTLPPSLILDRVLSSRHGVIIAASTSFGLVFKLVDSSGDYLHDEIKNEIDIYAKLSATVEGRRLSLPFLGAFTSPDGYVGFAVQLAEPVLHWRDCRSSEVLGLIRSLHQLGLVHGDVKPTNLARLADHSLRLLDFGRTRAGTAEEMDSEMEMLLEDLNEA
ncbi:uncharacterized protein JCM10292_002205 [Rhodotorula paludigena]|uniref:uncharacterized protein n=1 Tax=Rhodotorula paludigena TaxID=86838 RepID=UPI00317BE464